MYNVYLIISSLPRSAIAPLELSTEDANRMATMPTATQVARATAGVPRDCCFASKPCARNTSTSGRNGQEWIHDLWWLHDIEIWKSETYEFEHVSGTDTSGSRQPRADKGRASGHLMLWFQSTEGIGKLCIQELLRLRQNSAWAKAVTSRMRMAALLHSQMKLMWCIKTKIQVYQGQHGLNMLLTSLEGSLKGSPWICAGLSQIHVHQVSSAFCKGILKLETYSSSVLLCFFLSTVVPVHHSQLMPERQTFYFQSLAVPAQQKGKNAGTSLLP